MAEELYKDFYEKLRYNTRYRQEVMYEYYNW